MLEEFLVIGKRLPRVEAVEKVKGEAIFTSDIQLPRMLHAKFLRSPYAHAKIVRIDITKAESLSGVKCILTCNNIPKIHPISRRGKKFEYLLDETVHCAGQEVAAVAAVTKEIGEEALELIDVEYEVLPAVLDKEEAMKPGAPLAHPELGTNLFEGPRTINGMLRLEYGDVEKGFAEADYVIKGTYSSPMQHNVSPEPRTVICRWVGNKVICWASSQSPQFTREQLSACLRIPLSDVRVISDYPIGGYGGKNPEKIAVLVALLSKRTGRPVKALFTREEDFIATWRRLDSKIDARVGVKRDGTITAIYTGMISNYGRDSLFGYLVPDAAAVDTCSTLYKYQNSRWEGYHVITNTEDYGGMNGFGDSEAGFCIERLMDEAAEKIGMDPTEFRLKNCARYGDRGIAGGFSLASGPVEWGVLGPDIDSFPECIRRVVEKSHWKQKWKGWTTPVEVRGTKRIGIGIAIGMHFCIHSPLDSATVKMNQDGTVDVLSSDPEIGQGLKTAMAQVVAEVLGLQYEDINVVLSDTSATPYGPGVFAERGTLAGIGTAYRAALDVRRQLFEIAARRLGVRPLELEAKDRRIYVKESPEKGISIAEGCLAGYQIIGNAVLPYPWFDDRSGKKIAPVSIAATVAEVEVDTETGELTVLRLTSAHDCGRAINPSIIENQIDMSLTMANGWVRTEELIIDKSTGVIINPNLLDYKLMTILDMPKMTDLQEIIVEFPTPWGPFGAKGMSQTATTTAAPAIANAIYNAIGVRIRGDHLTPQRILESLGKCSGEVRKHVHRTL
jgi:xanthine dehydrogenase molybdenum-binding subunit